MTPIKTLFPVMSRYYKLEIREGYRDAEFDCMVCDYSGGPVVVRRDNLLEARSYQTNSLMILDWSLRAKVVVNIFTESLPG